HVYSFRREDRLLRSIRFHHAPAFAVSACPVCIEFYELLYRAVLNGSAVCAAPVFRTFREVLVSSLLLTCFLAFALLQEPSAAPAERSHEKFTAGDTII